MAGFTDILGSLIQQGMSQSSTSRAGNALGSGTDGILGELFDTLGKMTSGANRGSAQNRGGEGREPSLDEILDTLGVGKGAQQGSTTPASGQQATAEGSLGDILGNLGNNKAVLGGLGALAGAILGGGKKSTGGAVGGGLLAMLASLAMSALKNSGHSLAGPPSALLGAQTGDDELALENDAEVIVKAMINATKADGKMDNAEIQRIIGKLDDDGLTQDEKDFFAAEASKPLDLDAVIASAGNKPEMAAQIYAASLLAIEVDTPAEQRYMQQLASGLRLHPQVTAHIERTLGV